MCKTLDTFGRTWKAVENSSKGIGHLVVGTGIVTGDSKSLV